MKCWDTVLVGSVQAYSSGEGREKMKGSIELAFLFLSLGVFVFDFYLNHKQVCSKNKS